MKQRAFTLMELMIVIVIIGILSAVGMVMFGGQAEKAKIAAAKSNHKSVVKFITYELMQCNMGETTVMSGNLTCSGRTRQSVMDATVKALSDFKNPFVTTATGDGVVQSGWCKYATNGGQVGYVWVNGRDSMDHVTVCTCTKIPCNGSNVSEKKIYLD